MSQETLTDYERRVERFAHTQAQILKLVNKTPGLTTEQLQVRFFMTYQYHPVVDNKLRALRKNGLVESKPGEDGLLRWYPKP
jgi:hypothetical protein